MARPRIRPASEEEIQNSLHDLFTPYRLSPTAWSEADARGWFKPQALMNHVYRRMLPTYPGYELGWLTLGGKQLGEMLLPFLDLELVAYKTLRAMAFECAHRQLDWALAFAALSAEEKEVALDTRPKSAAELLRDSSFKLLGLVKPLTFVEPQGRHGSFYPVLKVPVNPDPEVQTKRFLVDVSKAIDLIERANLFDAFADKLEAEFLEVEGKLKQLSSQRKLALKPFLRMSKYLDPELINDANIQLAGAMFYRARSLADYLRKVVYNSVM